MKTINPILCKSLIFLIILAFPACRHKPRLDLGYHPRTHDQIGSPKMPVDERVVVKQEDNIWPDMGGSDTIETLDGGWEAIPVAGTQLQPRDFKIAKISDRRWQPIYFSFNQTYIGETERQKLEVLTDYLVDNGQFFVIIEGHCDARGSEEFNRALGEKRALVVRDYLTRLGVSDQRIRTISYGEERPADGGESEAAFQKNRRAEFIIGVIDQQ